MMVAADFSCKKSHNLKPNLLLIASKGVFNLDKLSCMSEIFRIIALEGTKMYFTQSKLNEVYV